jgi:hypothetical protein
LSWYLVDRLAHNLLGDIPLFVSRARQLNLELFVLLDRRREAIVLGGLVTNLTDLFSRLSQNNAGEYMQPLGVVRTSHP